MKKPARLFTLAAVAIFAVSGQINAQCLVQDAAIGALQRELEPTEALARARADAFRGPAL